MLELHDALTRVLAAVPSPIAEAVELAAADGRILAAPVASLSDLPAFDNSAMDGYAVRASSTAGARPEQPVSLRLVGRIAAGEVFAGEVGQGECVRLFTGSPLPQGADAVVMQEDARPGTPASDCIQMLEPVQPGENVRRRGEDCGVGAVLAEAGAELHPGRLSLLSAAGIARVRVGRRPRVGVLATGSELCEPGRPLAPGQVYESNRLALAAAIQRAGGVPLLGPLVLDTRQATVDALQHSLAESDVVVTSGGVSVGELDYVKDAFRELGGELNFWKVNVKPGRPFAFGTAQGKLLFGLPGNPVSALVTFLLLAQPALRRWQGARQVALPSYPGVLVEPLANPGDRPHYVRVKVDEAGRVSTAGTQASHILTSLAASNGLVRLEPNSSLSAGDPVTVLRWDV
jgi:molybdopterin molybdotransferase